MTIQEVIKFFKEVEDLKFNQPVNYALHFGINQAAKLDWSDRGQRMYFSEFLQKLAEHDPV